MAANKFHAFDRHDLTYKIVNDHPIQTTVLIPKALKTKPSGLYPVMVHWHGGGFIVGHRMYEGWFASWQVELALARDAIIITPDYRLIPESNAADVMKDAEDFWEWLHEKLPSIAKAQAWHAGPDLTKIASVGESAGGYISVQSATMFPPTKTNIKVIISTSAPLFSGIPYYSVPGPKPSSGGKPIPQRQAESTIRAYLRGIKPGQVRTGCEPSELWDFMMCVMQQAYWPRLMAGKGNKNKTWLDATNGLTETTTAALPPMWIIHGADDTITPCVCSSKFVDKIRETHPEVPVLLNLEPGEHSFDVSMTMDEQWVADGLKFVDRYWP
ncbi:hypothetical protein VMCG_08355 [Cytospora schulzeri]|uniref:Alpha/beta hydrolase fold-3 domain-containing protein n=1 Tax=Cytospora schulzeri TaxID=448051 RepID=A0A423VVJ4_9PEZI|nr:hypothetical protein VMCG_08355 [Valsa malicola]